MAASPYQIQPEDLTPQQTANLDKLCRLLKTIKKDLRKRQAREAQHVEP